MRGPLLSAGLAFLAGVLSPDPAWSQEPATSPAPSAAEAGIGFLGGSVRDAEEPEEPGEPASGLSFAVAVRRPLGSWYWRPYVSRTSFDGTDPMTRGGVGFGREWRNGEVAVGLGVIAFGSGAIPLPSFHGRIGGRDGLHASLALLDDRGPLHGLVSAGAGFGFGDGGFALEGGLTVTEDFATAGWGELRVPLDEGRSTLGVFVARGDNVTSDFPTEWMQFGVRWNFAFGIDPD